jgi:hypothetical protein
MADYKQNMGAYQSDVPNDSDWRQNIGADQTDPPSFAGVDKVIQATGSIDIGAIIVSTGIGNVNIQATGSIAIGGFDVSNAFSIGSIMGAVVTFIRPGQDAGSNQGSANVWGHPLPAVMPSLVSNGDPQLLGQSPPIPQAHVAAGQVNGHEDFWYEQAHLLPRLIQELGNLVSEQVINCELFNADRNNTIEVTSITDNLGSGIEIDGVPPVPFNIYALEGRVFTLTVKTVGDLTIDATYTLHLSTGEAYTIQITGSRIVMFPIRPESPLREHLIFDTKIIEHVDSSEQRIANRKYPRGMFEATYKDGQQLIEMILFDRQSKIVAFPAWHEPAFIAQAASIDDTTVTVNTTDYANFYVGGYAVVLEDENTFDALKIKTITPTTLEFESGLAFNYTTRAQVMPLLTAYIEASSASLKRPYNHQYFNLRLHVDPEVNDIADDSAWSQYNSQPFMDGPNMIDGGQLAEAIRTKVFVIDNLTGLRSQVTGWDHAKRQSKKGWKTNNRQELWELRQLLHFLKGKQVGFYIPTFWKDLTVEADMQVGTQTMTIANVGFTINARQRWSKEVIRIILTDGTILIRTISNSSIVSTTQEQLTVDIAWGETYTPDDIERVEFLEKVRLDVDDITIIHYNALGHSECIVPIKEIDN